MRYAIPVDVQSFPDGFHSQPLSHTTGVDSSLILFSRVPPGSRGPQLHAHDVDQVYFTVSGSMQVQLGDDVHTVTPGTTVLIPAGTPHCNWNEGTEEELHLEVLAPWPGTDPSTFVKSAEPRHIPDTDKLVRRMTPEGFLTITEGFRLHPLVQRTTGAKGARMHYVELEPTSGGPDLHFHDFDQFYFVLEGSLEVKIGTRTMTAGPNTLVVLPAGTVHTNFNPGPGIERHIAILTPEPAPGDRFDYTVDILPDLHPVV
jgi:mannose-6-phosphate isomerase-like protein (cupin superfamily)